jgi:hypothetical protein
VIGCQDSVGILMNMIAKTRLFGNSQDYDSKDKKDSVGIVRIMIAKKTLLE